METIKRLLPLLILILVSGSVKAQYTGPGTSDRLFTVKEIRENAARLDRTDALVRIRGFVTGQINKDTFTFKDSTGTIHLEISKKHMPATPFDEKTEVIIVGEVDNDMFEEVEVEAELIIFPGS